MNSTIENDKPQLKTKTRNGTRKRGNLPDSISSTAEIFNKPQLKTKTRNGTRKRGNLPDSISSTAEIFNH